MERAQIAGTITYELFTGVVAHRALNDVHVTAAILRICLERYVANGGADDVAVLVDTVAAPLLLANFPFGPYFFAKDRGEHAAQPPCLRIVEETVGCLS